MADRYNTLTVILEYDMNDDDAEYLLTAIRQLRGVLNVRGNITDTSTHTGKERAITKTVDEKAKEVCKKLNLPYDGPAFSAIRSSINKQDRDTRHACAKAVFNCIELA